MKDFLILFVEFNAVLGCCRNYLFDDVSCRMNQSFSEFLVQCHTQVSLNSLGMSIRVKTRADVYLPERRHDADEAFTRCIGDPAFAMLRGIADTFLLDEVGTEIKWQHKERSIYIFVSLLSWLFQFRNLLLVQVCFLRFDTSMNSQSAKLPVRQRRTLARSHSFLLLETKSTGPKWMTYAQYRDVYATAWIMVSFQNTCTGAQASMKYTL